MKRKQRHIGERVRVEQRKCSHSALLHIRTEPDGCYWIECGACEKTGPAKHSVTLALLAWIVSLANKHPRISRRTRRK